MAFTDDLPPEGTDPWYAPLTAVWDNLKTYINTLVPQTRKVAGHALSADVELVKGDVGLGNVNNTSDADKPVSSAQAAVINTKVTGQNGATGLWIGTQAAYDAIVTKDPAVAYIIKA